MPNRFDIFLPRITEMRTSREGGSAAPGDQHRAAGNQADAKLVRRAKPLAEKQRAEHRHQHDA